ncbi:hypothetical protein RISK_005385 [Rhodopirellula islandica]|uniref:Uncharacterized protein n=1 Tax=Rhodopirellula islandica TaxID=595434 RepID=A0A0J1EA12_RHOIS|nr:hypothetical protein RISK_005385 [Rhodopirellula islandica]
MRGMHGDCVWTIPLPQTDHDKVITGSEHTISVTNQAK